MKVKAIGVSVFILFCTIRLYGQFDFYVENADNLKKEYCRFNPSKITEIRFQKDNFGEEYQAWKHETIFSNGRVSTYSQNSNNRNYFEIYNWEKYITGLKVIRYDSTFYKDTTNLHRFGSNLSNSINRQDTFILLFNENGKLIHRKGNNNFGGNSYKYDKHNNLIQFRAFDGRDSTMYTKTWKHLYGHEGRILGSKVYGQNILTSELKLFYDKDCERKYTISYMDGKPVQVRKVYSYYDKGKLIKRIEEIGKVGISEKAKKEFIFNEQEDIVSESGSTFIGDDLHFATFKYEYEYDRNNNWVKRTAYLKQNEEKEFKWFNRDEREIEYD